MNKVITIPQDIELNTLNKETNAEEKVAVKFIDFLINNPLQHPGWGVDFESLEASDVLLKLLQSDKCPKPGETLTLDEKVWEKLNAMVNYPAQPYQPNVGRQFLPFFKAIKVAE